MSKGTILISIEASSPKVIDEYRKMIHILFEAGVFNVRNGKAILNFDNEGLSTIETHFNKWKRDKPIIEVKNLEQFSIKMATEDKSNVAYRS